MVKTIVLTAEETFVLENLLSDCDKSKILKAHENEKFHSIVTKLNSALQKLEGNGPTAQLWVNYFRMVALVKQFIQAERMGDWSLHLNIIQQMLPFFHAARHFFMPSVRISICRTCWTWATRWIPLNIHYLRLMDSSPSGNHKSSGQVYGQT